MQTNNRIVSHHTNTVLATCAILTALTLPTGAAIATDASLEFVHTQDEVVAEPFFNAVGGDSEALLNPIRALGSRQFANGPELQGAGNELARLVAQYEGFRSSGTAGLAGICQVLDTIPCDMDLKLGTASPSCALAGVTQLMSNADTNGDGWFEAVVRLTFDTCTLGCVTLEYESLTAGIVPTQNFTVDIGDSDSNDGFCGNSPADTEGASEAQIVNGNLAVCNYLTPPEFATTTHRQSLHLDNGSYKICFGDQFYTFGQPSSVLGASTDPSKPYLRIPDTGALNPGTTCAGPPSGTGNTDVWIGLNRVISPACSPASRIGAGLRRARITLK